MIIFDAHPHISVLSAVHGAEESIRIVAGSGFVLLIWFTCGLISWGSRKWFSFKVLSFFAGIELTGWLLSCLHLGGIEEANDAADFLASSGMSAAALGAIVLLLGVAGGLIMFFGRYTSRTLSTTEPQPAVNSSCVEVPARALP
jgi:hypothetical protein